MTIKIEPGKSYRDREGRRWDYAGPSGDEVYPHVFCATDTMLEETFTDDGRLIRRLIDPRDLIAEWTEPGATPAEQPEEHGPKTLRDEFAMAALTGVLASPHFEGSTSEYCSAAFALADAMMEARKK